MAQIIPHYSGWRPRAMRAARRSSEGSKGMQREAKRSRLGNAQDRAIYKSAKGYKNPRYGDLCRRADDIHGIRR